MPAPAGLRVRRCPQETQQDPFRNKDVRRFKGLEGAVKDRPPEL
jgi:hypothetical protein